MELTKFIKMNHRLLCSVQNAECFFSGLLLQWSVAPAGSSLGEPLWEGLALFFSLSGHELEKSAIACKSPAPFLQPT
jgi:hypothetical protein